MAAVAGAGKTSAADQRGDQAAHCSGRHGRVHGDSPDARHNLGVALLDPAHVTFDGSVGYYCAGMIDGPTVQINGSAGWGLAESMLTGTVVVRGSAGNGAAATIRGGTVVIHGHAAARAGVSMKGGVVLIAGQLWLHGRVHGAEGDADRLWRCGRCLLRFYVRVRRLRRWQYHGPGQRRGHRGANRSGLRLSGGHAVASSGRRSHPDLLSRLPRFKKVVAGRRLWNFDKREWATWREAL